MNSDGSTERHLASQSARRRMSESGADASVLQAADEVLAQAYQSQLSLANHTSVPVPWTRGQLIYDADSLLTHFSESSLQNGSLSVLNNAEALTNAAAQSLLRPVDALPCWQDPTCGNPSAFANRNGAPLLSVFHGGAGAPSTALPPTPPGSSESPAEMQLESFIETSTREQLAPRKSSDTTVSGEAQPRRRKGSRSSASLYVKNLPPETTELFLYHRFAVYGALSSCKIYSDPTTGKCRGVAFVNYVHRDEALKAMEQLQGSMVKEGHQMHITLQAPRTVRNAQKRRAEEMQRQQQQLLQQQYEQQQLLLQAQKPVARPQQDLSRLHLALACADASPHPLQSYFL